METPKFHNQAPNTPPQQELTSQEKQEKAHRQMRQRVEAIKEEIRKIADAPVEEISRKEKMKQVSALIKKLKTAQEIRIEGEADKEIEAQIEELSRDLESKLNQRAEQFNVLADFKIERPQNTPEYLTPEHIKALNEIFGKNNLQPMILPKPEDLKNLDQDNYVKIMYPESQSEQDKQNGLISYRPSWWKDKSDKNITKSDEIWGQAYLRSMQEELKKIGGSLIYIESIQKPNYTDGSQHYGKIEGDDETKDPLLPLFKEAFGSDANRFNHSHDGLAEKLLPKAKEKIIKKFQEQGLAINPRDFDVILTPAAAFNLQATFYQPKNSQTNTWEWTSTELLDIDNKCDQRGGHCLNAGNSDHGGAANLNNVPRDAHWGNRGARLAVVFRKDTNP